MNNLRGLLPVRTCTKTYSTHRQYKEYIRNDFNKKCGYCDDLDLINGGKKTYQVDHFVPMNPDNFKVNILSNDYSNLVYACPFCNRAKWNKWPTNNEKLHNDGTVGFVDPCSIDYDRHFYRNDKGEIVPKTILGSYMHKEIKLFLKRHAILWNIEKLKFQIDVLKKITTKLTVSQREKLNSLLLTHSNYLDYLEIEND